MNTLNYAPDVWKCLNGIFCIYKPANLPTIHVRNTLKIVLCRDLNEMEKRLPNDLVHLKGTIASGKAFEVELIPNYADHELVSGARYQVQDIRIKCLSWMGRNASGVMPMAINDGCKNVVDFQARKFLSKYEIKGRFGMATDTFMADGKVRERSTFTHIRQAAIDRLLASIQASNQALAYQYSGVDIASQEAYELAKKGIIRPSGKSNPIIYSIKCSEFDPPYFILEIGCINETDLFLAELIHQIGVYLRSSAVCTQLRRIQFGYFTTEHALLRKHWTLENILSNITLCKDILGGDTSVPTSANFKVVKTSDLKQIMLNMQNKVRQE
ncbi:putative tRNA pseudouridine synthase 2, partial [Stegodyphus mimosarum]